MGVCSSTMRPYSALPLVPLRSTPVQHPPLPSVAVIALSLVSLVAGAGCGSSGKSTFDGGGGGGGFDGSQSNLNKKETGSLSTGSLDASFSEDAFFANDPAPMYCGPDGGTAPPEPGGTPTCPSDKNREGCPCPTLGMTAACWPGLRVDRDLGQCKDGTATCVMADEGLSQVWSACEGYVLPTPGATSGAPACKCFSSGQWNLSNLSPCFIDYTGGAQYAVSSYLLDGGVQCPMVSDTPPPSPQSGVPWSTDTLKVDCAGSFTLCYTIKAGSATNPQASDCVIGQSCVSGDYLTANTLQAFPPLAGWSSNDPTCAAKFASGGGYGEMTVKGLSQLCEPIGADDGGAPEVFNRVPYCSLTCEMNPSATGCQNCSTGGSGMFGN